MSVDLQTFFQDLQKRGIVANSANLKKNFYQLNPEEKIVYLGVDCTAESLHIGHLFLYFQTVRFAHTGFKIILVLGGATSKIGDPSDKLKERPQLEIKDIKKYQTQIMTQLERILIKPKKFPTADFAPLELFYANHPKLLNDIYRILKVNSSESPEKK